MSSRQHLIGDAFFLLTGAFSTTTGTYGLWDLARHGYTDSPRTSFYPLPFDHPIAWYIAGDAFATMVFAGAAVFILAFLDLTRP